MWLPRLRGPIDLRYDAAVYFILGTSLAEGRGYRLLNEPGEVEAVQYPPLLPLFVAAHQRVLGTSDPVEVGEWLRWSYALLSLVYTVAVYAVARRFLPPAHAFLAGLVCALHVFTYFLSNLCFAELPFAVVTMLFVLAAGGRGRGRTALAAVLGAAAFLLRTMGLALLAAWVAESLAGRRFKEALLRAVLAAIPVLAWQGHVWSVTLGDDYRPGAYEYQRAPYQYYNVSYAENATLVDPFRPELGRLTAATLAARVGRNLAETPVLLGEAVATPRGWWAWLIKLATTRPEWVWRPLLGDERQRSGWVPPWFAWIPTALLGALVGWGAVLLARGAERSWLVPFYLLASVGMMSLTPWPAQFTRYAAPLTPLLAICLVRAFVTLRRLRARHPTGAGRVAGALPAAVTAMVLGLQLFAVQRAFGRNLVPVEHVDAGGRHSTGNMFYYGAGWHALDEAMRWISTHARTGDIVASSAPHLVWLRTGRRAVLPPLELDTAEAARLLDAVPVRFVIVDDLDFVDMSRRYAGPVMQRYPGRWRQVFAASGGGLRVYRRED